MAAAALRDRAALHGPSFLALYEYGSCLAIYNFESLISSVIQSVIRI